MWLRMILALALIGSVSPAARANGEDDGLTLGGYPLCEASAAMLVDCPETGDDEHNKACLLVADNEVRDRLFWFETNKSGTLLKERREIHVGAVATGDGNGFALSDIEALVRLPGGTVLIVGSHSRNSRCEIRENRRFLVEGAIGRAGVVEPFLTVVTPDKPEKRFKCKRLFGEDRRADLEKVCASIKRAEKHANDVVGDKDACARQPAFNIEGALAQPVAGGEERVWIGLRAPLVDDNAVLLRQKAGRDAFQFDAAMFLNLDRRGIRELAVVDKTLWGIGGPAPDSKDDHILWRMDMSMLQPGVTTTPEIVAELPTSAEGLAFHNGRAFVFMDGEDPKKSEPMVCRTPSTYKVLDIPG